MTSEVSKEAAAGTGVCGVLLLICGVGCMIPGFILIGNNVSSADGLWSGALLLIAGVLGVVTWWKRNRGVITGFLVIAIIAIVALFIQSIIAGVKYSSYKDKARRNCYMKDSRCYCNYYYYGGASSNDLYCNKSKMDTIIASLLAIVIFTVIGGIVSFTGSIFGCMGTCSNQTQPGTVIVQRPVIVTTTTLPGYSAQQPGYFVQQPGYPTQQPGYPTQQPGYPAQQPGYPAQQPGYSAQQPGYSAQPPGYSAQQPGYSAQQPDHQVPQSDYQALQPGHQTLQPGHQATQTGHQTPQSDYQALQPDYLDLQPGHQAPESDYQALQPGHQAPESHYEAISSYQAPGPAYADPAQATGSYQQQVSDDPPPEYTKHAL